MNTIKFGKMEILPESGRILKLEPVPGCNVLWNNPDDAMTSYGWFNPGGDRVWISPENELFMPDGTPESYTVPAGVDPGRHTVRQINKNTIEMVNDISVTFFNCNKSMNLQLTATITELESDAPEGVAFAGYEQKLCLTAMSDFSAELRPAFWSIVQLPPGGVIMFPQTEIVHFSGVVPELKSENGICCMAVPAPEKSFKFGIPSDLCKGKMAYMNLNVPQPFLVVREFSFVKNGRYADTPVDAHESPCVQQFYFDDGDLGGFGEMEYHSEYLTPENPEVRGKSTLRAYTGTPEQLEDILYKNYFS